MTDEQIRAIFKASVGGACGSSAITFARAIIAASASAQPVAWRVEAVRWLRRKAADQATANAKWPRHAEAYPSWGKKVRDLAWLAEELEAEQEAAPYGMATTPPQSTADTVRVPREPTQAMMQAFCDTTCYYLPGDRERPGLVWAAMIAAAPKDTTP